MTRTGHTGTKVSRPVSKGDHHPWPLAELPAQTRRALLASATQRSFHTDEVLYLAGQEALSLYLVLEGRVRLLRGHTGRPLHIHDEIAGGALGEVPLFEGTTYPATAVAAEPTRCLVLQRDAILEAVQRHPELALAILARLSGRIRLLVDRLDRSATRSVRSRLADLVASRSKAANGRSFTLGATQQQAAEEIGTVRELVVRGLKALRDDGVIEARGGGRYVVRDSARLRRIAEES